MVRLNEKHTYTDSYIYTHTHWRFGTPRIHTNTHKRTHNEPFRYFVLIQPATHSPALIISYFSPMFFFTSVVASSRKQLISQQMDGWVDGSVLLNRALLPARFPNIATALDTVNKIDMSCYRMLLHVVGHSQDSITRGFDLRT